MKKQNILPYLTKKRKGKRNKHNYTIHNVEILIIKNLKNVTVCNKNHFLYGNIVIDNTMGEKFHMFLFFTTK